ncbi:TlyA family RNA methyltransferase [Rothia sp. ZJ932]|uniref:TlyA family RNA methyltransferase n=1 Tax=Rothia sp. ZJ932 TaxID=2810516 RepID=UPI0019685703|nr:TlyA family RNA methyltransferase [Rothia sp. ZJ932]QRZ61002.1 TlyA family RNA methyltransferase [Rothia sp. ZJ932]
MRLDKYLADTGLARSRTIAVKLIEEGSVLVNGVAANKSYKIQPQDSVTVRESALTHYVSRAGHKLAGALDTFTDISVAGKRCLDAGASTGGFTQVLLELGAKSVMAVDVGHDQLDESLRHTASVSVFEGMNARYMKPDDIGGQVELTVSDLSFISLTLVMESLAAATAPGGDLVLMVKPQFEVKPHLIGRGGVVTDPAARLEAVENVKRCAEECGLTVRGISESKLPGQDGNLEYFLWLSQPAS